MLGCRCCGGGGAALSRRSLLRGLAAAGALAGAAGAPAGPAEADILSGFLGSMVSPEQERQLGEQAFGQLLRKAPRSRNLAMQATLQRVGERVVRASGSTVPLAQWDFVVFAGDQLNAFALPGGKVGFFEGIFRIMRDDAHLATVLGHEVGHVNSRHSAERIGAEMASSLGARLAAGALGLDAASGLDRVVGSLLGAGVQYGVLRPYGRGQELEADRLGLGYMARAGYDPAASVDFWRAMMGAKGPGGATPAILSTHPSDGQRIAGIQAALPEARAVYARTVGRG